MCGKSTPFMLLCLPLILVLASTTRAFDRGDAALVAYWAFNEGSGTVAADLSENGYDGTLNGGATWTDGVYGSALHFNGSGANVGTGKSILNDVPGFTLAGWVSASNVNVYSSLFGQNDLIEFGFIGGSQLGTWLLGNNWQLVSAAYPFGYPSWHHVALTGDATGVVIYIDGLEAARNAGAVSSGRSGFTFKIGADVFNATGDPFLGEIDDVWVFSRALKAEEIQLLMKSSGGYPYAMSPNPPDGGMHPDTWVTLSWRPGDFAVSHDVYLGDNLNDVNGATHESNLFRGNQVSTYYVAGFPGFAYPNGLVPGTTYYWRIDEVNVAEPNSPWKGPVWSFSIPPKKAYNPVPANGAESVAVDAKLSWTAGFGAKLHTVYFGNNFDTVANAVGGAPTGGTSYNPGPLKRSKIYYWRVDEFDGAATYKGDVWSFTTQGAVGNPLPANGAVDIKQTPTLNWTPGAYAASHEVYFGTDAEAIRNATKTSPEFKATKALGDESYVPGKLAWETTYYWRIDEVNSVNPDSPWVGKVWSFTTAGFAVIDDFEDYDAGANQIWYAWHDGLGYGAPGTPPYFAGNGTGAAVGDETTASFTEETIVHGGKQSMPVAYDNNKQGKAKYSEVELKLTAPRDWSEEGVGELSIWFRGLPASVGSFIEAPAGTYTMTASGTDIWDVGTAGNYHDEFHFAYKTLTGTGSIIARVQSVQNTNGWAKAGVMIRETLTGGSRHMFAAITPSNGVAAQGRPDTGAASFNANQTGVTAPHWVKLERDLAGNFTVSHSANGTTWQPVTGATPQNIQMGSNVYIGLAVTSHDAALTCQAVFTNVTTTGTVSPQWAHQDIGIASNAAEPLYVVVSNAAGQPAVVVHPDPKAAQITTWTEWIVSLQSLAAQGITLTNVDRIAVGLGTRGNQTTPGGSGKMYFDDIRLYRPRTAP